MRVAGLDAPPWHELTQKVQVDVDNESEPNQPRRGWQKKAAGAVDNKFFSEELWPALSGQERALIRSQTGPLSAMPFISLPTNRFSRFDSQRVLLLRRLHLPLLSARQCPCGRPLHRSACAVAGVLGRRGYPLEIAAARVCREAGAVKMKNHLTRKVGFEGKTKIGLVGSPSGDLGLGPDVWNEEGVKLGTPVGSGRFVEAVTEERLSEEGRLWEALGARSSNGRSCFNAQGADATTSAL